MLSNNPFFRFMPRNVKNIAINKDKIILRILGLLSNPIYPKAGIITKG